MGTTRLNSVGAQFKHRDQLEEPGSREVPVTLTKVGYGDREERGRLVKQKQNI